MQERQKEGFKEGKQETQGFLDFQKAATTKWQHMSNLEDLNLMLCLGQNHHTRGQEWKSPLPSLPLQTYLPVFTYGAHS